MGTIGSVLWKLCQVGILLLLVLLAVFMVMRPAGAGDEGPETENGVPEHLRIKLPGQSALEKSQRDLAEGHLEGGTLSKEGEHFIGRCIRVFDPCLSCATH